MYRSLDKSATTGGGLTVSTTADEERAADTSDAQHGTRLTADSSGALAPSCLQQQHVFACFVGHARLAVVGGTNAIVTSKPIRRAHHWLAHTDRMSLALITYTIVWRA